MVAEKLKLYNNAICPFAQRAWMSLEEVGIDYDIEEIDLKAKPVWYKDVNPEGKVPAVQHKGKVITESSLICEYLADEFPVQTLLPKDAYERYLVRMFCHIFQENVIPVYYQLLRSQDTREQGELKGKLLLAFQKVNNFLVIHGKRGGHFLLGDQFSLAEISALPWFVRLPVLKHYRDFEIPLSEDFERLHQWHNSCLKKPSVNKTSQTKDFYIKKYADYALGKK